MRRWSRAGQRYYDRIRQKPNLSKLVRDPHTGIVTGA